MPWARFDDRWHEDVKVRRAWKAAPAAVGLFAMSITYCGGNLTDGFVPTEFVESQFRRDRDEQAAVKALVDTGLWVPVDDGWQVPDWEGYTISREVHETNHRQKVEAGRKGGQAKAKRGSSTRQAPASGSVEAKTYPDPTRPDPTVSPVGETTDSVVVVPPPVAIRPEINEACDVLAQAGLHVHDRTTVERLADEHPQVDMKQAAINCADWLRSGNHRVRHPLRALTPFVTSDDAPKRKPSLTAVPGKYGQRAIRTVAQ
jgi:hypothetical protein